MKAKLKRNILIFFLAIVLIGVVTGYMIWNKPHREVKNADAVKITATDLYKIFTTDSASANSKYLEKIVAVSGEVKEVSLNQQKQQTILLKTSDPGASVNCTMEENANDIKAGDITEVKGICKGYNGDTGIDLPGDIVLTRCYCSTKKK